MSRFFCKRFPYFPFLQYPSLKYFTTASPKSPPSSTAQSLINSCGLSLEAPLSTSPILHLQTMNPKLLNFLKSQGFSNTHLAQLVTGHPLILRCRIESNLKPKIEFFLEMGFSVSDISDMIKSKVAIVKRSLKNQLKPSFIILKSILRSNDDIMTAIKRSKWLLAFNLQCTMVPNVTLLIGEGVLASQVSKLIISQPRVIVQRTSRFVKVVESVRKFGVQPNSPMFIHVVIVLSSMTTRIWERKFKMLRSLGWSEEELMFVLRREPYMFLCSEEKIRNLMDFYMKTMKLEPSQLCLYPKLLMFGFYKRILPRFAVLEVLKSRKLVESDMKPLWMFYFTEKRFLDRFVTKYTDEVPGLVEFYLKTIATKGISGKGDEALKNLQL